MFTFLQVNPLWGCSFYAFTTSHLIYFRKLQHFCSASVSYLILRLLLISIRVPCSYHVNSSYVFPFSPSIYPSPVLFPSHVWPGVHPLLPFPEELLPDPLLPLDLFPEELLPDLLLPDPE